MRIGIDARMYGLAQRGIGRYIAQLIQQLEQTDTSNEYVIFLRTANWDEYQPQNPHFRKVLADIPWYGWREQFQLPIILGREHLDLIHFPHWNVPILYGCPFVVTIHDLILVHYPDRQASTQNRFIYWIKYLAHRLVLWNASARARHILVPTEFGKKDLHNTLGIPLNKITVTPLAPFSLFTPLKITAEETLKKFHITKPYILYVGAAYPHKNLTRLVHAWNTFCVQHENTHQLVLCGKKDQFYQQLIHEIITGQDSVICTDFVTDDELTALYQHATLYIFPSLYEGFGLPPLEAMQHQLPVIAANTSCLPEVLGDAAVYVDPLSETDIANAITRVLNDAPLQTELRRRAQKLLVQYDWKKTALSTWEVYQSVV